MKGIKSDNSGGVVVGALVCQTECRFFSIFSLLKIFLSSRRISIHNEIPMNVLIGLFFQINFNSIIPYRLYINNNNNTSMSN